MVRVKIAFRQRVISVLALLLLSVRVLAADGILDSTTLEGHWKLSDKPVLVDIRFDRNWGAGHIYPNDQKP